MEIDPQIYRALVVASALRFYKKTGRKINESYTPKNMMRVAHEITGIKFKARAYEAAAIALMEFAAKREQELREQ